MAITRINTGRRGERLAESYLKRQGYKIIEKNYKTRHGEIDVVANDGDSICFVEVRSRGTKNFGLPEDSINKRKQNQISKAALFYIKKYGLEDRDCRFDVVCIDNVNTFLPNIRLIKNAFELDAWYRY